MKKILKFVSVLSCLMLFCAPVCAETLLEALAYTYETNPALAAQRAYLRSVDERVAQAKSGYRPSIAAVGNAAYADQKMMNYPGIPDDVKYDGTAYDAGVVVSQPIFSGFKTMSSVDHAMSVVKQERENTRETEQIVLLGSATSYVDVIAKRAVLELQKNQEQVLARHLKSYQKRFQVGDLTKTDVAQAEARLERAKTERIVAEGELETANATYVSFVGKMPPKETKIEELEPLLPVKLSDCLGILKVQNPRLKSAEYTEEAAKHNIDINKGDLWPKLDLEAGAGYQWKQPVPMLDDHYDSRYLQIGAVLSVPLYQAGSEYAKIRESKQLANQARISLEQIKRQVTRVATQSWERLQAAKSSIVSLKAQVKASKMALDGVIREAGVGSRTVLDVLDAEQEHLNYQVALVRAERDMTVATLDLLASIGSMTAENLNLNVDYYDPDEYYNDVRNKFIGTGV